MDKLIGFRKLGFILVLLAVSVTLLVFGYVTGGDFASVMSGSTVAFMGANLGERALDTLNKHLEKGKE